MSENVRVDSVDALLKFRSSLCLTAEKIRVGLDEAEAEIQRAVFWVKQEQNARWKTQIEKRSELVVRAKSALNRKKLQRSDLGSKFSYVEEEKELLRAQHRLEEAKAKLKAVQRWSRMLDEESFTYKGVSQNLGQIVDVDVPNALASLDKMAEALQAYVSPAAPVEQTSTAELAGVFPTSAADGSMRRAAPLELADPTKIRKLRRRSPPASVRSTVPVLTPTFQNVATDAQIAAASEIIKNLGLQNSPPAPGAYIVVAAGAWEHPDVYLERLNPTDDGDSGWFLGYVDDTLVNGYEAAPLSEILERRKQWAAALLMPIGTLIVFHDAEPTAVLGPDDALLWPTA